MTAETSEDRPVCWLCECRARMARSPIGRHVLRARREMLRAARNCLDRKIANLDQILRDEPEVHSVKVE